MKWQIKDIAYLKKAYLGRIYIREIAKQLNKSIRAVQHKATRLGLIRSPVRLKKENIMPRPVIDARYYKNNKYEIRRRKKKRIWKMKEELIKKLGGKCQLCGYNKCRNALDFHHIGQEKENCISVLIGHASKEKVLKEANKCILLCANCHRELHSKDA